MSAKARMPPFAALRAFHAAATHGRFRDAAEHLGVTESAVSHQVRRLEEFLHTALFDRSGQSVRLTVAGARYLEQIDPAMRQIQAATEALLGREGRRSVRLTLQPSIASNWLIPRMSAFERAHPDIDLQLVTTTRTVDLKREQVDLAIRQGAGKWAGLDSELLFDEAAFPVCAPGYLTPGEGEAPVAALARGRLIINSRSPDEWCEWALARGLQPPDLAGSIEIEGHEQALQVAMQGHGLAIGRRPVIDDRMEQGLLVAPFGTSDITGAGHYLCQPSGVPPTSAARALARWLQALARDT